MENTVLPGSIVVAVDGSSSAHVALEYAVREAMADSRALTLVHAAGDEIVAWVAFEEMNARIAINEARRRGRQQIEDAVREVKRLAPTVETTMVVRSSGPHSALMEFAPEAAMVVVGAHDDQKMPPVLNSAFWFAGQQLACPVVIPRQTAVVGGGGVLVLADGTPYSRAAVEYAFEEAGLHHQPLTVVHCLPDPPGAGAGDDVLGDMDTTARMEAALGPSLLAFQRAILDNLTVELSVLYPEVSVRTVLDDESIDDLVSTAGATMDTVVLDGAYWRRCCEQMFSSDEQSVIGASLVLLPSDRPVVDEEANERLLQKLDGLEVWDEFEAAVRDALPADEPVRAARRGLAPTPAVTQATSPPPRRRSVRNTANWLRRRTPPEFS